MIGVLYDRSGIVTVGALIIYPLLRNRDVITVKGYCKLHDVEFVLPPRTEAPFRVECPVGHEKITRVKAIIDYLMR